MAKNKKCVIICCDLGGVLILNSARNIADKFTKLHNLRNNAFTQVFNKIHKEIPSRTMILKILKENKIDPKVWENFITNLWRTEKLNKSLLSQLYSLRDKYTTYLILTTNNTNDVEKVLHKYNISELFDKKFVSQSVGAIKSDRFFWKVVLRDLNDSGYIKGPGDVFVIDDDPSICDITSTMGFITLCYTRGVDILEPIESKIKD